MTCREGHVGVFASAESRASRDVRGNQFIVRFTIVDKRPKASVGAYGPYNVSIVLKVSIQCFLLKRVFRMSVSTK